MDRFTAIKNSFRARKWLICAWIAMMVMSHFLHVGHLLGSDFGRLSLIGAALPVIAYCLRGRWALPLAGIAWALSHVTWPVPITLGVPTFFATLSWQASRREGGFYDGAMHFLFPLGCMALFCLSAEGGRAWPYSLYWLIPPLLFLFGGNRQGIFSVVKGALKSTFIAHAAGSVIWVYLVPLTAGGWLALIPVVAVERLILTGWAMVSVGVISYSWQSGLARGRSGKTAEAEGCL